ncbi:DUF4373 domain-containing protein [Salipaludibacillus sp. HK11]|uniref:DUF4373 domain-containing protein n=1 Tax=Salipaludibacillus sp. HK11 TaxID=3394320 RepID=UPI0039FC1CAB
MARPKKEGLDYFPHDTDAMNDEKIEALRMLYGNDGYAFYFILLERIYRTNNAELDVSDSETIQILCRKVAVTENDFYKMLETSFKREIFCRRMYEDKKVLSSNGIKKRTKPVVEKRHNMRKQYKKAKEEVSDVETTQNGTVSAHKVKESKVKESKGKKSNKDTRSKLKFETHHLKLADLLFKLIKENNPSAKNPNLENWANVFRLMMDRDKRSGKEIQEIIIWSQNHHFWYKNILSPDKLRSQFDRLLLEKKDENNNPHPKFGQAKKEPIPKWMADDSQAKDDSNPESLEKAKQEAAEYRKILREKKEAKSG